MFHIIGNGYSRPSRQRNNPPFECEHDTAEACALHIDQSVADNHQTRETLHVSQLPRLRRITSAFRALAGPEPATNSSTTTTSASERSRMIFGTLPLAAFECKDTTATSFLAQPSRADLPLRRSVLLSWCPVGKYQGSWPNQSRAVLPSVRHRFVLGLGQDEPPATVMNATPSIRCNSLCITDLRNY